jgi:polar amino acid transport system ATP-binding protein
MIDVRAVSKTLGTRRVLASVSFRVERGQVMALVGPSGAGKSTLLRCINALERFDDGAIAVFGETLPGAAEGPIPKETLSRVRRRVGFVFQQFHLFPHMTARENVMEAPVHVARVPAGEARERAGALLATVGLAHRADAYPSQLSGGEQQRVAIARALAMDPEVLLLDEPTSALDPARSAEVRDVLRSLAARGTTMLLVTHEVRFAREVASDAVVLAEGAVIEAGKAAEVLSRPVDPRTRAFLADYADER